MINEKDITDDVIEQWKEINEEKEGLNEQTYKGSVLEERLRLTRQIFALEQENASLKDALEGYKQNAKWCDKCDKITDLEKKNKVLTQNLEDSEIVNKSLTDRVANLEYQLEGRDITIKELEAQIEKMKNQWNCKNNNGHCVSSICPCKDKWELRR